MTTKAHAASRGGNALLHGTLMTVGLLLLAGCATSHSAETPPPSAPEAQLAAPHTNEAAVLPAATPLQEMLAQAREYYETKQGKEVLIGGAAGILLLLGVLVFARIFRGSRPVQT